MRGVAIELVEGGQAEKLRRSDAGHDRTIETDGEVLPPTGVDEREIRPRHRPTRSARTPSRR